MSEESDEYEKERAEFQRQARQHGLWPEWVTPEQQDLAYDISVAMAEAFIDLCQERDLPVHHSAMAAALMSNMVIINGALHLKPEDHPVEPMFDEAMADRYTDIIHNFNVTIGKIMALSMETIGCRRS